MSSTGVLRDALPGTIALLAFALLALLVLYLAGRPLDTSDLWFHLKMGEVYASEGPWPASDPLLHTAHADAPVQHEWLFGVAVHGVETLVGHHGLRVLHVLALLGILGLVCSLARRESGSVGATCLAGSVFLVLAWWRLIQLRPDLASIPAAFLLYRLLLESEDPASGWRILGASVLLLVWANLHSLFAVGLLLLGAGTVGELVRVALARRLPGPTDAAEVGLGRARRLALALAAGLAASLLNPRGVQQHLTFITSSRETGIWAIEDEWSPFVPWAFDHYGAWVSPVAWLVTDLLLISFVAGAVLVSWRLLRSPSRAALRAADPVLLALAAASCVALLVSVRFLWMGVFPLLFLLRLGRSAVPAGRWTIRAAWALAAACVTLTVGYERAGGFRFIERSLPSQADAYLSSAYLASNVHETAARFLRDTGVEGNLFNAYTEGGFLGYWLAPKLRTFIDGRTEHYPPDVLRDYFAIVDRRGGRPGETLAGALDRREVDLFVGVGLPIVPRTGGTYTTTHLEGAAGWTLVFRAIDQAVYLRANERNRGNLDRVAAWYAREGVPFDRERGLDAAAVVRERPDWAIVHRMLPVDHAELVAALEDPDENREFRAQNRIGLFYALLGVYAQQLENDRRAAKERPSAKAPLRRLVYGYLRQSRAREALDAAERLVALGDQDARSTHFLGVARQAAGTRTLLGVQHFVDQLPLLTPREVAVAMGGRFENVRMQP
jgi:hypothetical protein